MSYEFDQAKAKLDEAKNDVHQYLIETYNGPGAEITYTYLENIIDRIIKREDISIKFFKGGSPLWYYNVFSKLSSWLAAELDLNEILNEELNKNTE